MNFKQKFLTALNNNHSLKDGLTFAQLAVMYDYPTENGANLCKKDYYRYFKNIAVGEPKRVAPVTGSSQNTRDNSKSDTDLKGYKLSSFKIDKEGKVADQWFRADAINAEEKNQDILNAITNFKPAPATYKSIVNRQDDLMLELFITDFHLNGMDIHDTPISKRVSDYIDVVIKTVNRAEKQGNLDQVVYTQGGDFFNCDNWAGSTTKLTPQFNNTSVFNAFEVGLQLTIDTIEFLLKKFNKVHFILLPGNHDMLTSFYLGKAVEMYYSKEPRITFDTQFSVRKVYTYYNTSIFYHHGNQKHEYIRDEFINFYPKESVNKYVEIHVGDLHHVVTKEMGRFTLRQFPTLSNPNTWSNTMGYFNTPKALSQVYSKTEGRIGEIDIKNQ